MAEVPDLVRRSRLEAQLFGKITQHVYYRSERGQRSVRKEERWKKEGNLGRGGFGEVILEECIDGPQRGELRAVKRLRKSDDTDVNRELSAIALFSDPKYEQCFVQSYGWYELESDICIAMEYIPNGHLGRYLNKPLPEEECRCIISQVLEAIDYMHEYRLAHRDMKPQNILVVRQGPKWWVKVADFGISKRVGEDINDLRTQIGTSSYIAPEVLSSSNASYTVAVDLWAIGVITFLLLTGQICFKNEWSVMEYAAGRTRLPLGSLQERQVSDHGCHFVRRLLESQPDRRPTARESLNHQWLQDDDNSHSNRQDLGEEVDMVAPLHRTSISTPGNGPDCASKRWSILDQDIEPTLQKADSASIERTRSPYFYSGVTFKEQPGDLENLIELSAPMARSSSSFASKTKTEDSGRSPSLPEFCDNHAHVSPTPYHSQSNSKPFQSPSASFVSGESIEDYYRFPPVVPRDTYREIVMPQPPADAYFEVANAPQALEVDLTSMDAPTTQDSNPSQASSDETWTTSSTLADVPTDVRSIPKDITPLLSVSQSKRLSQWKVLKELPADRNPVCVTFSPDGKWMAASFWPDISTVEARIWDTSNWEVYARFGSAGLTLKFSSDSSRLAWHHWQKPMVIIWDIKSKKIEHSFAGDTVFGEKAFGSMVGGLGYDLPFCFSPNGRLVPIANKFGTVAVWNTQTGKRHQLVQADTDSKFSKWRRAIGMDFPATDLSFSLDGKYIASGGIGFTVLIRGGDTGMILHRFRGHKDTIRAFNFTPDSEYLISWSCDGVVCTWNLRAAELCNKFRATKGKIEDMAVAPDGKSIAVLCTHMNKAFVEVWETLTGDTHALFEAHEGTGSSIAFSPDGLLLATGASDGVANLWDVSERTRHQIIVGCKGSVDNVKFSADGRMLCVASSGSSMQILSMDSVEEFKNVR